jgi:hypothetical protein
MTDPLPIAAIDLGELARLLDSRDYSAGYLDPETGQVYQSFDDEVLGDDGEPVDLDEVDWVALGGSSSHEAYDDMAAYTHAVADPSLARRLDAALEGRGAFRRFKGAMYDAPEAVRRAWLRYQDARSEIRAVEWLLAERFVREPDGLDELRRLHAVCDESLSVARTPTAATCDAEELPDRWPEMLDVLVSGESVVIVRDGQPWATIERVEE